MIRIDLALFCFLLVALPVIGLIIGATISDSRNHSILETTTRRLAAFRERLESQDGQLEDMFLWLLDRKEFYKSLKEVGDDMGVRQFYTGCATAFFCVLEKYKGLFK